MQRVRSLDAASFFVGHRGEYEIVTRAQLPPYVGPSCRGEGGCDIEHVHGAASIDQPVHDVGLERVLCPPFGVDRDNVEVRHQRQRRGRGIGAGYSIDQRLASLSGSNTWPGAPKKLCRVATDGCS